MKCLLTFTVAVTMTMFVMAQETTAKIEKVESSDYSAPPVTMTAEKPPVLMPVPSSGMSVGDAWNYGGWIMWVLAVGSIFGVALALYLLWTLRTNQIAPHQQLHALLGAIGNDDLAAVRRLCEERATPLALITLAALDHLRHSPNADPILLRADMEAAGARQAEAIQGQTQWLLDLSVIAPMLGLLGTVLGMLKAFGSVATDIASAKPVVLAAGVSQAIVTTIFGLLVAIPAMIAYAYFRRRASRQITTLEAGATSLAVAFSSRLKK
ncbi:MAG: MotA/TolQ/ExbB proton channel family protein [Lentisphaerae bacterium]|nr:MotA/TolQ/ExbB proton channel family protein [Lentisphaerota bacterium]